MKPKQSKAWVEIEPTAEALGIDAKTILGADGSTPLWVMRDGSGRLLTSRALPGGEASLFFEQNAEVNPPRCGTTTNHLQRSRTMRNRDELQNLELEIKNAGGYLLEATDKFDLLVKLMAAASTDKEFLADAGDLRGLVRFFVDVSELLDAARARLEDAERALEALRAANPTAA